MCTFIRDKVAPLLLVILLPTLMATSTDQEGSNPSSLLKVPTLLNLVEKEGFTKGASSLINVWKQAIRNQKESLAKVPKTILSPSSGVMTNLVPMDGAHPLYGDALLRTSFLLDHMIGEALNPDDIKETLSTSNLNGQVIYFKKDKNGQITVNNVKVGDVHELSDGTFLYILDDVLQDYRERIRESFKVLQQKASNRFGPLGAPLGLLRPQNPS